MNVTVNSRLLAQELRVINRIIAAKPVLPILSNVHIRATDRLEFWATDLEVGLLTSCHAQVNEPGVMTLPAKTLFDMVERLDDLDIELLSDRTHTRLVAGAFKSRLQMMSAEGFPSPPTVSGDEFTLSATDFHTMIEKTRYAISDKTAKYVLNGALLTFTEKIVMLVATDGRRLALSTTWRTEKGAVTSAVIPSKTLDVLLNEFTDGVVTFSQNNQHLFFSSNGRVLNSRTIDGKFPNYSNIIPKENNNLATIDRMAFAATLRRVGLVADANHATFFAFDTGVLTVTSSSNEIGEAYEQLAVSYAGPALKVCANWEFVLQFLEASVSPSVTVELKDSLTPMQLKDGLDFLNVVMLMRM